MWPFTKSNPDPQPEITTEMTVDVQEVEVRVVTLDDELYVTKIPGEIPDARDVWDRELLESFHKAPRRARRRLDIWKRAGFAFLKENQIMIPWERIKLVRIIDPKPREVTVRVRGLAGLNDKI